MKKFSPQLTIIIHTKNEERDIAACITSCRRLKANMLVVDMQSSDATVTIAKHMGAHILKVPDSGFVEPARQKAITAAKTPWILILDADERLSAPLIKKIKQFLKQPDADIVRLPRKNIMLGTWVQFGLRWPDYQVRLFRKTALTWPTTIHAQPLFHSQNMKDWEAVPETAILHIHSQTISQLANKTLQQSSAERYYDAQGHVSPQLIYQRIANEFPWRFDEHQGNKDGITGYISAKFMEYYRFLEFAQYWERLGYPEMDIPTPNRKNKLLQMIDKFRHDSLVGKIAGYKQVHGWLSPQEAYGLAYTASLLPKNATIVEIGSWKGKSTICLAKGLRSGQILAIDPFDASGEPGSQEAYAQSRGELSLLEQFKQNLEREGVRHKVTPLVGFSKDFLNQLPPVDFLFIDGDHSKKGCQYDYEHFSPLVKVGGYLAFHDCRPEMPDPGPTWVITHDVLPSRQFIEVNRYDALWVGQKVRNDR